MEEQTFDREQVIERMRLLQDKRNKEIFEYNQNQEEFGQMTGLINLHKIKYLEKMKFAVEGKEELVEKYVFMVEEEKDGTIQFRYYDEDMNLLGIQNSIDQNIFLNPNNSNLIGTKLDEHKRIADELASMNKAKAKTLDELKKEQESSKKGQEQETETKGANGPQLTKAQVQSMSGPITRLDQKVDYTTLGNVIGLSGEYIKLVDIDTLRKILPDVQLPATSQRNIPLEVNSDGTANIIGEDKLQYSNIEGRNSAEEHTTVTNEGKVTSEQNIETFNIVRSGGTKTIGIGYGENGRGGDRQEIKLGERDRTDPTQIAYTELESVHIDDIRDDDTAYYLRDTGDGRNKGEETIDRAEAHKNCGEEPEAEDVDSNPNNNNIHDEDVKAYAIAFNIRIMDEHGYPTQEYDLDEARLQLEEKLRENPDASLEEIIEEDAKTLGPQDNRRY